MLRFQVAYERYGNRRHDKISKWCRDEIRDKTWFQTSLIGVIFAAGILVGVQTYDIPSDAALLALTYVATALHCTALHVLMVPPCVAPC